ncbi:hypothetical protein TorRG33x02_310000 [Trema orientale]|uniref:Uncharacterized protein n=1 Tax=Trema orientale TaxID=63057 RepID=A0A2P5BT25_TREOI|nr:hypothetical protein TorRG33x02_310000 [Trema orientale]
MAQYEEIVVIGKSSYGLLVAARWRTHSTAAHRNKLTRHNSGGGAAAEGRSVGSDLRGRYRDLLRKAFEEDIWRIEPDKHVCHLTFLWDGAGPLLWMAPVAFAPD